MLRKAVVPVLLLLLVVAVAGCASSDTKSSSTAPADVAGTWVGTAGTAMQTVNMVLKQDGNKVTGNLDVPGNVQYTGPIRGTVRGNTLDLEMSSGFGSAPALRVNGDQISGILAGGALSLRRTGK
jgi:hypothetical protein